MNMAHYAAAIATDNAWQAALIYTYGPRAGQYRYQAQGVATPLLRSLYAAKRAADEALLGEAVMLAHADIAEEK